jgi:hypothetical protein
MSSLPLLREDYTTPAREPATIPNEWRGCLNTLRILALECRSAARTDLFHACALLSNKQNTARDAHARALMKCLDQAVAKQPIFYQPGVTELSFDEAWLMRAIIAARDVDSDSLTFLIRSRVPHLHQRQIAFLVTGISEQFSQV